MLRLNKFCGCCKIELGGYVLGWLNLVASIFFFYSVLVNFREKIVHLTVLLIVAVIYGLVSYFLIQGTKYRNHIMTQPFRMFCFVGFLAIILKIVLIIAKLKSKSDQSTSIYHLFIGTVALVVEFYVLLVVDSLHKKFRDEKFLHS